MRFGNAGARLFLNGLGVGLATLLGLLSLASAAPALTWEEVNQQLARCIALTDEAIALVGEVKGVKDVKGNKKEVAKIKKAEHKLGQMIDIYQALDQTALPPTKLPNVLREIKSSISGNRSLAQNYLKETQSLRRTVEKEGLGLAGAGVKMTLLINLRDLRYHTSRLQGRLKAHKLR